MARLQWTEPASVTLATIVRERRQRVGFVAARALRQRIIERVNLLKEFPELGQRMAMSADDDRRILHVASYRIIYQIDGETVSIIAVQHARTALTEGDRNAEETE